MKKIQELSKFLNHNFPDSLDDMKSSLNLLNEQLLEIDKQIANSMNELIINNQYEMAREYIDKSEELNEYTDKINYIIQLFSEDNDKLINETINTNTDSDKNTEEEVKKGNHNNEQKNKEVIDIKTGQKNEKETISLDNKIAHYLNNDLKNREPAAFYIHDEGSQVENWIEMLIKTIKILIKKDEDTFIEFINDEDFKGLNRCYFSFSKEHLKKPKKINLNNKKLFVESDLSDNVVNKLIQKLIHAYKIEEKEYKVYLKEENAG